MLAEVVGNLKGVDPGCVESSSGSVGAAALASDVVAVNVDSGA